MMGGVTPRRRRLVPIVLLALFVLAGACAGSSGEDRTTGSSVGGAGTTVVPGTTAVPTTTTTVPTTTTTIPRTLASGALRLPSGLVVPVRAQLVDGRWVVGTPCGEEAFVPAAGSFVEGVRVVLDPGHGGPETGTIGPNGLHESELNLDVAERIEQLLVAEGISVALVRRDDQQWTIAARAELITSLAPELVVSVHHNGGAFAPSPDPGTIVFHQADDPGSRRLAGLVFEEVTGRLGELDIPFTQGQAPGALAVRNTEGTDYYGILRRTVGIPTVIVESLYLSSQSEAAALERDEVRQVEAEALAAAIRRYLTTLEPGSGFRSPLTFGDGAVPRREPSLCTDPPLA